MTEPELSPEELAEFHRLKSLEAEGLGYAIAYHKGEIDFVGFQWEIARLALLATGNLEPSPAQINATVAEMNTATSFISAGLNVPDN